MGRSVDKEYAIVVEPLEEVPQEAIAVIEKNKKKPRRNPGVLLKRLFDEPENLGNNLITGSYMFIVCAKLTLIICGIFLVMNLRNPYSFGIQFNILCIVISLSAIFTGSLVALKFHKLGFLALALSSAVFALIITVSILNMIGVAFNTFIPVFSWDRLIPMVVYLMFSIPIARLNWKYNQILKKEFSMAKNLEEYGLGDVAAVIYKRHGLTDRAYLSTMDEKNWPRVGKKRGSVMLLVVGSIFILAGFILTSSLVGLVVDGGTYDLNHAIENDTLYEEPWLDLDIWSSDDPMERYLVTIEK